MKIRSIDINGFGVWNGRRWDRLAPGINVFHGPNEVGKTTLMTFIRSVLFGFERRSHPRRYEPLSGGDYGGAIEVTGIEYPGFGDGPVRIQRSRGRHVRGKVIVRPLAPRPQSDAEGTGEDAERILEQMLGGTTRTLYHNVFAFGLEELEHFRTLEESEVASHISGAGMGVGARRWSRVWKDLEERRSNLFLPRGQNATLNRAFRALESVRQELDETEAEPEDYFKTLDSLDQVKGEMQRLEVDISALDARIRHHRKLREAAPHRMRRQVLERELDALEPIEQFPDGGVDRLNLLFDQRRRLESESETSRHTVSGIRAERRELTRQYAPQDLIRKTRAIESLRLLLPRRDALDEVITGATARRDAILLERQRVEERQRAIAPPAPLSMVFLVSLVGVAAFVLQQVGYSAARWGAAGLILALVCWYYYRLRSVGGLDQDIQAAASRLDIAEADLQRAIEDGRQVAGSIGRLVGRSDYSHGDLETESLEVRELEDIAERLRSIEARLEAEDRQAERLRKDIEGTDRQIQELFEAGGAASESEFFRRSDIYRRRQELMGELRRTPSGIVETPDGAPATLTEAEYPDAVARHDAWVARLAEARTEAGRLEERLSTLSRSEQRSRARLRQESVVAEIDDASEQWAVLTLCRTLLTDTRQIYETERQPEVLRHASRFFGRMTGGNWVRVISPLDSGILVESPQGDRVSPENLSRGTAEQLYLAMRLALVREYSRHVAPLPVVLDDIFVNFDPVRTRRSIEAVRDLAETHQILLFTCHPHLVEMVEEIVPRAELYPLQ